MAGPEYLQGGGARLGRRRPWVLVAVLVVLGGLTAVRLVGSDPETSPAPAPTPVAPASPTSQVWPDDLPSGTLFAAAGGAVHTIDTRTGVPTRTGVETDRVRTSMTGLGDGVLVWQQGGRARHVLAAGRGVQPVRGELRGATSFLPGPDGSVWATRGGQGQITWRLVDADGRASRSIRVRGSAVSDGSGGLLEVGRRGFRVAYPAARGTRQAGEVIATGPDGYVVRSCLRSVCRFVLHHHSHARDTELTTAVGNQTSFGTLSRANRLLAVTETVGGTTTLRLSAVRTGQILRIFPTPKQSSNDAVWLDDRWLALISEDQLVLYDADEDRLVLPDLPLHSIGPLAWRPA